MAQFIFQLENFNGAQSPQTPIPGFGHESVESIETSEVGQSLLIAKTQRETAEQKKKELQAKSTDGRRGKPISEEDTTLLIQIALATTDLYVPNGITYFWEVVAARLADARGGAKYSDESCKRKVETVVESRRMDMEKASSWRGRRQDYVQAVDAWIRFVDAYNEGQRMAKSAKTSAHQGALRFTTARERKNPKEATENDTG
ncbi:hypothetical protein EV356DRAFT_129585 [Viridothelium virens]|uniref:Uncharacterized protein n=1 Tax=Viridothelium virens TaxID=1048519 RepID=A0A6A6HBF9_VIRVR|nr:hypothetical protein EV356DRAFT_129585 [Viridothelium virens]